MSEDLAIAVGRAQADAAHALERAREAQTAAQTARTRAGQAIIRLESLEKEVGRHDGRIAQTEENLQMLSLSTDRLTEVCERLEKKVPAPKHPTQVAKEAWKGTSRKGKAAIVTAIVALLSGPEVVKHVADFIGRLLAHIR